MEPLFLFRDASPALRHLIGRHQLIRFRFDPGDQVPAKPYWPRPAIRDAVEAALSDIILLGTEEHVRLADRAVRELVAGHPVHTHELVVSLRLCAMRSISTRSRAT